MHESPPPGRLRRRRIFWFLIGLIPVMAIGLAVWIPYQHLRQLVRDVEEMGGTIGVESDVDGWLRHVVGSRVIFVQLGESSSPLTRAVDDEWLERLQGLQSLRLLNLSGTQVGDDGLAHLRESTDLRELWLDNTQITDAGLRHLIGSNRLFMLSLKNTQVGNAGLSHLAALTSLEFLVLDGTQLTDAGLEHLKQLTHLKDLTLNETSVTEAGIADLKQALPQTRIHPAKVGLVTP